MGSISLVPEYKGRKLIEEIWAVKQTAFFVFTVSLTSALPEFPADFFPGILLLCTGILMLVHIGGGREVE